MSDFLSKMWAAQIADEALFYMNNEGPFGPEVPADQKIAMTFDEKVTLGNHIVNEEIKRSERNRRRREARRK